ncbi:MAG: AAA family ATPase [Candidatus Omnitrophica bacterium]|nr:AAA family ATPase [Candidatus Omnitrophota bacterium]
MSYHKILGFEREPFSTSPDPDFLYMSKEHEQALTNTLIELNLRRGLNIILGDIGTGKTTLSRKLIQELGKRDRFVFQMILNPSFENEKQFLAALVRNFNLPEGLDERSTLVDIRDAFEKFLLDGTLNRQKVIILIIDEAQKLTDESLETLRLLLNYETNEFKLIQIVLLGQMELLERIIKHENFYDRINFKFSLYPFDIGETRAMINFRIRRAGYQGKMQLFMDDAIREIHAYTHGYPRRITMMCHKALKYLILKNRYVVDQDVIKSIIEDEERLGWQKTAKVLQPSSNFWRS